MATTTPREPEWIADAPNQIERTVTIDASADAIWSVLANNERWPEWFPGFRSCGFTSEAPHGKGSVRSVHQDQFKVSELITAWEPGERWAMTVLSLNAPVLTSMAEEVRLSEVEGQTKLEFRIGIELSRIGRLLKDPLLGKTAKSLDLGLSNLAAQVDRVSVAQN